MYCYEVFAEIKAGILSMHTTSDCFAKPSQMKAYIDVATYMHTHTRTHTHTCTHIHTHTHTYIMYMYV